MLTDPHASKRGKPESCRTCRFAFFTPKGNHGDCHFMPPTADSFFPTVYPETWCSQYKEDQHKIEALKAAEKAAATKPQEK